MAETYKKIRWQAMDYSMESEMVSNVGKRRLKYKEIPIQTIYADKYKGQVILRFDDTNPAIVEAKYFDAIKEGLLWLGCTWDKEVRASKYLEEFYNTARVWIENKFLYACLCKGELLSKNREEGIEKKQYNKAYVTSLSPFSSTKKLHSPPAKFGLSTSLA